MIAVAAAVGSYGEEKVVVVVVVAVVVNGAIVSAAVVSLRTVVTFVVAAERFGICFQTVPTIAQLTGQRDFPQSCSKYMSVCS